MREGGEGRVRAACPRAPAWALQLRRHGPAPAPARASRWLATRCPRCLAPPSPPHARLRAARWAPHRPTLLPPPWRRAGRAACPRPCSAGATGRWRRRSMAWRSRGGAGRAVGAEREGRWRWRRGREGGRRPVGRRDGEEREKWGGSGKKLRCGSHGVVVDIERRYREWMSAEE